MPLRHSLEVANEIVEKMCIFAKKVFSDAWVVYSMITNVI